MTTSAIQINGASSNAIVCRSKTVGLKYSLGVGPISVARKALKASGLTNREASAKIAAELANGKGSLARLQTAACLEAAAARGMFATQFEIREGSFCLRGSAAPVVKDGKQNKAVKEATEAVTDKAIAVLMAKLGCTKEEAAALL